jgi:AraC family transcriptional regulator, activator of mtrCDE
MDRFRPLVHWIREETHGASPGALAIATDLASAMFMLMLRRYLASDPPVDGLLALLGERTTAQAVAAMLRDLSREWMLDELAALAASSRATLVRSFYRIAGVAPLTFLTKLNLGSLSPGAVLPPQTTQSLGSPPMSAISPKPR